MMAFYFKYAQKMSILTKLHRAKSARSFYYQRHNYQKSKTHFLRVATDK